MTKKNHRKKHALSEGFTLLELLISMTLLVLILIIAFGAVRMGSRSVAAGEKKMDVQERFRAVLSIMDAQIQSQMPLTYESESGKKYYFMGTAKTLRLATNYSIWGGQKGYVIVEYAIETDNWGNEVLYAGEQVPGIEGSEHTRLIEASGMSFEYFYKEPTEEQGKWMDRLSEGTVLPERIRFHLDRGQKRLSQVFPVRVRGEMRPIRVGTSP